MTGGEIKGAFPLLIDTHAHLDLPEFDHDREALFAKMRDAGISGALIPAVSPAHWPKRLRVAGHQCLYALGIHPWYVTEAIQEQFTRLNKMLSKRRHDKSPVAVGECGLDKIKNQNRTLQLSAFERHIIIAKERSLPLIIHSVRAHNEVLAMLRKHRPEKGGIIHGFYGSCEVAEQYLKLGFKLGTGGFHPGETAV